MRGANKLSFPPSQLGALGAKKFASEQSLEQAGI